MPPIKVRKLPVEVEALRFSDNYKEAREFVGESFLYSTIHNQGVKTFVIKTLEGNLSVTRGDWIIKGIKGEFYPCKPDVFEQTYERVEE